MESSVLCRFLFPPTLSHMIPRAMIPINAAELSLEKCSLVVLSLYQACFSKPFSMCSLCWLYVCSIVNYSDPKDRMVAVVRWYLSAFHAGRKVCCLFFFEHFLILIIQSEKSLRTLWIFLRGCRHHVMLVNSVTHTSCKSLFQWNVLCKTLYTVTTWHHIVLYWLIRSCPNFFVVRHHVMLVNNVTHTCCKSLFQWKVLCKTLLTVYRVTPHCSSLTNL